MRVKLREKLLDQWLSQVKALKSVLTFQEIVELGKLHLGLAFSTLSETLVYRGVFLG